MDSVENYEFSTFCGKLVAEETGLELRTEATERDSRLPCVRGAVKPFRIKRA